MITSCACGIRGKKVPSEYLVSSELIAAENDVAELSLRSHKGWVTGVSWSRERLLSSKFYSQAFLTSAYLLASSSHDGTIKLWDIRAKVPLHTMVAHPDSKALCIDWHGGCVVIFIFIDFKHLLLPRSHLLSGGADCKLQTHLLKNPTSVVSLLALLVLS